MVDRDVRKAENESLFRNVNERIEDTAVRWGTADETIAFVCECSNIDCTVRVELRIPEYEQLRGDPAQFVVAPGHADLAIEEVVQTFRHFEVVRKLGAAAAQAEADDPRA